MRLARLLVALPSRVCVRLARVLFAGFLLPPPVRCFCVCGAVSCPFSLAFCSAVCYNLVMFFSASHFIGSRAGSVGSPVAGCPGAAWVWSVRCRSAAVSLALALPVGASRGSGVSVASAVSSRFGVSASVRCHRGRVFVRVRGSRAVLRSVAVWFSGGGGAPAPAPLPVGGVVAFAGSRLGSPVSVVPFVAAVAVAGGSVRVGCARGVDQAVRLACPSAAVVSAAASEFAGLSPAAALAARTRAVVSGAAALVVFAPASGVLGAGSSLAVATARAAGLPVWVCSPVRPSGAAWVARRWRGVSGWLLPSPSSLFVF